MIALKKLDLKFVSEENGRPCHKHVLNGEEVPGCTSVSGLFQDDGWKFAWPPKLMSEVIWAKAKEERKAAKSLGLVDFDGVMWTWPQLEEVLKTGKNAWRAKRDKSADTGSLAHSLCETFIKTGVLPPSTVPPEALHCFNQFLLWVEKYGPAPEGSELQVGSEKYLFAGILDLLCRINGKLVLLDIKTSKEIKDDYNIQLAGLCICLEEMGVTVDERAILHIPKEGKYEYRVINSDLAKDKLAFLVGLEFYRHRSLFFARNKTNDTRLWTHR